MPSKFIEMYIFIILHPTFSVNVSRLDIPFAVYGEYIFLGICYALWYNNKRKEGTISYVHIPVPKRYIIMDTIKIGNFLSELRKEQGLTQEALGEKLGVTNKTVSRWENGNYLPPIEMLQELSNLYSVSINEILCGERIAVENYQKKAEETLTGILTSGTFSLKERTDFWKRKWKKDHQSTNISLAAILVVMFAAGIYLSSPLLIGLAPILGIWIFCMQRNEMMKYVEKKLYD